MASVSSPIADLSYRNYDGPLDPPYYRWWAIAKTSIRIALKKKAFWVYAAFSGWFYLIYSAILYFFTNLNPNTNTVASFLKQIVWKDQFLTAFSWSQIWLFVIALLIGAGSIADDNRANALLVYLSKPCSKADYLIGKWFGIFIPILIVSALPTTLFYLYAALSYRSYGFITNDPWLIFRLILIMPIPAIFHASVSLGISSMFNQGRVAGLTYSGIYFLTYFFTTAVGIARTVTLVGGVTRHRGADGHVHFITGGGHVSGFVNNLFYCSVDGIQIGLSKLILGTRGDVNLGFGNGRGPAPPPPPPIPPAGIFVTLFIAICAIGIWTAWRRIRPVEVIGG